MRRPSDEKDARRDERDAAPSERRHGWSKTKPRDAGVARDDVDLVADLVGGPRQRVLASSASQHADLHQNMMSAQDPAPPPSAGRWYAQGGERGRCRADGSWRSAGGARLPSGVPERGTSAASARHLPPARGCSLGALFAKHQRQPRDKIAVVIDRDVPPTLSPKELEAAEARQRSHVLHLRTQNSREEILKRTRRHQPGQQDAQQRSFDVELASLTFGLMLNPVVSDKAVRFIGVVLVLVVAGCGCSSSNNTTTPTESSAARTCKTSFPGEMPSDVCATWVPR